MKTTKHLSYLIIGLFLCCIQTVKGQGWMKFYDTPLDDYATAVTQTFDEGFLVAGFTTVGTIGVDISDAVFLVRTNSRGDTIWTKKIDFIPYYPGLQEQDRESILFIKKKKDGHFILAGTFRHKENIGFSQEYIFLVEIDEIGTVLWTKKQHFGLHLQNSTLIPKDVSLSGITLTDDEHFIISGDRDGSPPFQGSASAFVAKLNPIGDVVWEKDVYQTNFTFQNHEMVGSVAGHIQTDNNTTIAISNITTPFPFYPTDPPQYFKTILSKLDSNGNLTHTILIDSSGVYREFEGITKTSDDHLVLCGNKISKIDYNGNITWTRALPITRSWRLREVQDKGFVLLGDYLAQLFKLDSLGTLEWSRTFGVTGSRFYDLKQTNDSSYILCGDPGMNQYGNIWSSMWLVKADRTGNMYTNKLKGKISHDSNNNCAFDSTENGLENIIVQASKSTGTHSVFTNSDNLGQYELTLDSGDYEISIHPQGPYWDSCQATQLLSFTSFHQSDSIDFSVPAREHCPFLNVDISIPRARVCTNGTYYVHYCNHGTESVQNTSLEINLNSKLAFVSSSIPTSQQSGNSLFYNVGALAPGECGDFTITVFVDCNAALGETLCSEAYIKPDTLCNLELPYLQISDSCLVDTVQFFVHNLGATTPNLVPYWILEDSTVVDTGWMMLNWGDTTSILHHLFDPNASCQLVIAPNSERFYTVSSILNCTSSNNTSPLLFPNNNTNPFSDYDCTPVRTSFDPNDKNAQPVGFGSEHYIFQNEALEYKIRFQNTGNDTAYRVVLVDTLPSELDITSLSIENSSHSFTWEVFGNGVLEIVYDNIMLPDSNVNEPASHGFITFKIKQNYNLPIGSKIKNSAAIYFDFNKPIITNEAFHTISDRFLPIEIPKRVVKITPDRFLVYPNPTSNQLTIQQYKNRVAEIELFHINGQLLLQTNMSNNLKTIDLSNFVAGAYILRIKAKEGTQTFKIMKIGK